jgi:UDP-N-acetylmuramate dehydrogenase
MNWWEELKGKVKLGEPLKAHTTFKIGGAAKFFIEPKDIDDLKLLLNLLKRYKIPFLIIGAGSNILASDKGVNAAVVSLNSAYFKKIRFKNGYLEVGSGTCLSQLIFAAERRGLAGLEFLIGIPGTVGGALVMNAGISEKLKIKGLKVKNIGELVIDVTVIGRRGNVETIDKNKIRFGYRSSDLSKYIILGCCIKTTKKSRKEINKTIDRCLNYRLATQGLNWASAGCVFKNPSGDSAGRLIDLCGLKERKIGDAYISLKHANFILNRGNARSEDVFKLMDLMRKAVRDKFNIRLEHEIKIWQ